MNEASQSGSRVGKPAQLQTSGVLAGTPSATTSPQSIKPRRPTVYTEHWFAPGEPFYYCGGSPTPQAEPTVAVLPRAAAGSVRLEPCQGCVSMHRLAKEL